jgi:hypothetical protein
MTAFLEAVRAQITRDVAGRGLARDPQVNLLTWCAADLAAACQALAAAAAVRLVVVTGFYLPQATPPAAETDGPLGALFLARALTALGMQVALVGEAAVTGALEVGLRACGLAQTVPRIVLPTPASDWDAWQAREWSAFCRDWKPTHLLALERVGPSHTPASLQQQGASAEDLALFQAEVPPADWDRCHTMRGRDVTPWHAPAHRLFEAAARDHIPTIGIGDGGNELGMGKIPWGVIRRNVPQGGLIACRVPTDWLIVCGVSNWGAYGLAAGIAGLQRRPLPAELWEEQREQQLLELLVREGPLVDGVLGCQVASVDGLSPEQYLALLPALHRLVTEEAGRQ